MKEYFITTKRTGFATWSEADIDDAFKLWGDPAVSKYLSSKGVIENEYIYEKLKNEIETFNRYKIQYWPVYLLQTGELIGCSGFKPYENNILEMGMHIKPKFWGARITMEIPIACIRYAFEELKVEALLARHHPDNRSSRNLLAKLGFENFKSEFCASTGLNHPFYLLNKEGYIELIKNDNNDISYTVIK
ncbi:MAG: GNAT family N-acetyltransferase [Solirubrobacterales bacterium]